MNNTYIIEDNLDFKKEMNNSMDTNNIIEICLITQQKLTKSHISLPCSHKFNYIPLFKEVCSQKMKNVYTTSTLEVNQIKCPYCRTVFDTILPYLPSEVDEKKIGVNYPLKYCMKLDIECDWVNKKGVKCVKQARHIDEKCYCKLHHTKIYNIIQ